MRMIKADDFEIVLARVTLAAQQFVGRDQEAVSFSALFARVGDRISLADDLALRCITAEQEAAALVRIIANAVLTNFSQLFLCDCDHALSACSTSAMMS